MTIKSVIFDNDGTLYAQVEEIIAKNTENINEYLAKRLDTTPQAAGELRLRLFKKYGIDSTTFVFGKEFGMEYDELVEKTFLRTDLREVGIKEDPRLREMLREIRLPKIVLTNNDDRFADKVVTTLGVRQEFKAVVGSVALGYVHKPKVAAFLKACEYAGFDPTQTVMVDDLPEYLAGAKAAGMTTILVGKEGIYPGIDFVVPTIYDVGTVIRRLTCKTSS